VGDGLGVVAARLQLGGRHSVHKHGGAVGVSLQVAAVLVAALGVWEEEGEEGEAVGAGRGAAAPLQRSQVLRVYEPRWLRIRYVST
jgi:hypothetical protein